MGCTQQINEHDANHAQAAGEDAMPLVAEDLLRSLEDPARAPGAAALIAGFCRGAGGERREALQEHADSLMTVRHGYRGGVLCLGGTPAA